MNICLISITNHYKRLQTIIQAIINGYKLLYNQLQTVTNHYISSFQTITSHIQDIYRDFFSMEIIQKLLQIITRYYKILQANSYQKKVGHFRYYKQL